MTIYRQIFGATPPPGEWSLIYYETESSTAVGRPHAIAGLRSLIQAYPNDAQYQITLGRILTYDVKTRVEGRHLLDRYPADQKAVAALRRSLLWDAANPSATAEIRQYLTTHDDPQLADALRASGGAAPDRATTAVPTQVVGQTQVGQGQSVRQAQAAGREQRAPRSGAQSVTEAAAYEALNDRRLGQAEALFQTILQREPENARALAGLGYVRMQQGNFMGAISFLEQATHDDADDTGMKEALDTARFWFHIGEGQTALSAGDLTGAEKEYGVALKLRPDSAEAINGLGGTLVKAQQPSAAIPLFERVVQADPASVEAWRGLLLAQVAASNASSALATDRRVPAAVHAQLAAEPEYLRGLAAAYSAAGRDADAQRTLQAALRLAYPADAKSTKVDTEIQLADALLATNRWQQASTLYSQVLATDHANTAAWQGLVRVEHAQGHDEQALLSVESMPPASYAAAMRDAAFEVTVASVYQAQKKFDVAEDLLEKAIAQQSSTGQKPSVDMQLQLASLYAARSNTKQAMPIYQQILDADPTRADAWAGLIRSLHAEGNDKEALAEAQKIPTATRSELDNNASFLQTLASVYVATGQSRQAAATLNRVERLYAAQHAAPPAELDIQNAWLLYNSMEDVSLYRQLMALGGRSDLTAEQSRTVEAIWSNWAVRRSNQLTATGNSRYALAVLNAAARAFPDNPAVLKTLANGYAQAGEPEKAVAIYKAQNMASASLTDYQVAVSAALSAGDKIAETWLHSAQTAFPNDAQILLLSARYEQSRGNTTRAIDDYRASLKAMPPPDPSRELAALLRLPAPTVPSHLPSLDEEQDLSILLAPGATLMQHGTQSQPKPSDGVGIPYTPPAASTGDAAGGGDGVVPPYMSNPNPKPAPALDVAPATDAHPKTDGPQSRLELNPVEPNLVEPLRNAQAWQTPMVNVVAVRLGDTTPHPSAPQAELTDVLPTAHYLANARTSQTISSHPDIAAAQAASIRRHQSATEAVRTGVSHPPSGETIAADVENAQYVAAPQSQIVRPANRPAGSSGNVPDSGAQQYPQPRSFPTGAASSTSSGTTHRSRVRSTISFAPPPIYPVEPSAPAPISLGAEEPPISESQSAVQPVQLGESQVAACTMPLPFVGGYYESQAPVPMTARQQAESELSTLESLYSGWLGGSGISRYRTGTAGLDKLYDNEAPIELSTVVGRTARLTAIATPVFLNSGTLRASNYAGSSVPILGTLTGNSSAYPPAQQLANGIGGELQLTTRNFGIAAGYTPYDFLIQNITGHARWSLFHGHFTVFGDRDAVKDTQLSYAGLRDPGTITPSYVGHGWGGVVASTGGGRIDFGSNGSGFYFSGDGGILHGYHVQNNSKAEASMGGYFRLKDWPGVGSLTLGSSLYATHFQHNEVGLTYGHGGYFSPKYYYVASVPLTFVGSSGSKLHYLVSGSLGAQSFDQNWAYDYPLDAALQSGVETALACTVAQIAAHSCGEFPVVGDTKVSYSVNSQVSYRIGEHWFLGGFVAANNGNNYNSVSGGFSFRYAFHKQHSPQGYPTGQFPSAGFRPLQLP